MKSDVRKKEILITLIESDKPITGAELAARHNVTRQIIVQDIALLKAEKNEIISTGKGYILQKNGINSIKKTVTVCHSTQKIEEELRIIVDLGGRVLTTAVEHPVYGYLGEALNIKCRKDIDNFIKRITETGCEPLLSLTNGIHKHTIEADNDDTMNEIFEALDLAGYLIS